MSKLNERRNQGNIAMKYFAFLAYVAVHLNVLTSETIFQTTKTLTFSIFVMLSLVDEG